MSIRELNSFSLVGGTALALQYGHRISVDLDLFFEENIDHQTIIEVLTQEFKEDFVYRGDNSVWGIFCFIKNIKVDIVYYPHQRIRDIRTIDGIRMYSDEDIIAMKINAILGRGAKKDFWDIQELLHHYSINEMVTLHKEKYPNQMLLISIPYALTYFKDAEESEDPISLKRQNWGMVKRYIQQKVNDFLK